MVVPNTFKQGTQYASTLFHNVIVQLQRAISPDRGGKKETVITQANYLASFSVRDGV